MKAKAVLSLVAVGTLHDDDCFFFLGEQQMREAEAMQARLNAQRVEFDPESPTFELDVEMFGEPHMVYAVAKDAGDTRISQRTTDGKKFVWEDNNTIVLWAPDRARFEQQLEWVRQQRSAIEKEQVRLQQARTKKKNKAQEVAERTLVAGI